jgi:aryl-alcohol dehydrogenase-like predicted oxidoreductase
MIAGYATPEGTVRYRDHFQSLKAAGHFRQSEAVPEVGQLWLSSLGIGTYLGQANPDSDRAYIDALVHAIRSGINVVDTAINYRNQRSERNVGAAIQQLVQGGKLARNEILVCTKAGYMPFDSDVPPDPGAYLRNEYVDSGIAPRAEIAGGMHCMAPSYLADQMERSRTNLGLETIDVFYVHNPETQLGHVPQQTFYERLRRAFEFLEGAVQENRIRWYGAATWSGFRANPADPGYLSLERFVQTAQQVAGDTHHFRFVQLPFNLAMLEAYAYGNQIRDGEAASLLYQANALGIAAVASGTLYQGNLVQGIPQQLQAALGMSSDAEAAIQFVRSATGITTALVGMGRKDHVQANLKVAVQAPLAPAKWEALFTSR